MKKGAYSFGQLMDQLRKLPKKLSGEDGFYRLMIDSVIRRQEDDESKDGEEREQDLQMTRQIFTWVSLSKRQLFLEELEAALAMQAGSDLASDDCKIHDLKRGILFFGGGLVEVRTTKTGVASVQLIHQTAREFLLESSQPAKPYHLDQISGDKEIAVTCCRYLRCIFTADILLLPPNEEHGYMDQLTAYLEKHTLLEANVDVVTENGETLLHAAAASQDLEEITQLLIDHDAIIEALNNKCETPLYVAASKGHAKVVELLLLEAGFQVTPSVLRGKTALYAAAHAGHRAIAELILPLDISDEYISTAVGSLMTMTPTRDEASSLVSLPPLTSEAHPPPPRRRVTLVRSKQQQQQAAPPSPAQRHPMLGRIAKPSSRPPKRRVILMRTQQQQHRGSVSEPPPCSPPKRRRVIIVRGQGTATAAAAAAVARARNHAETEVPAKFTAVAAEWRKVFEGKAACTEAVVVVSAGRANPGNARGDASQPSVTTRSGRISRPPARFVP
ncbi:hypothetical protein NHJ13051_001906 [Beauveria bassiana]